jgi:hypothetical protein
MYKRRIFSVGFSLTLLSLLSAFSLMGGGCDNGGCNNKGNNGGGGNSGNSTSASSAALPAPGTPKYNEAVQNFFTGSLSLKVGAPVAREMLEKAKAVVPNEPAILLNLALVYYNSKELDKALEYIAEAKKFAPNTPEISLVEAYIFGSENKYEEAKKACDAYLMSKPNDLVILYKQQDMIDKLQEPDGDKKRVEILDKVLSLSPENIVALIESARLSAKMKDSTRYKKCLDALNRQSGNWTADAKTLLTTFMNAPVIPSTGLRLQSLRSTIVNERYIDPKPYSDNKIINGENNSLPVVERLLKMQNPPREPAEPDMDLTYVSTPLGEGKWTTVDIIPQDKKEVFASVFGVSQTKSISFNGKNANLPGATNFIPIALDREHPEPSAVDAPEALRKDERDYKNDIIALTPSGAQILTQGKNGTFTPKQIVQTGSVTKAFAADLELDGDLDIVFSTKDKVIAQQNRGNNTFVPLTLFSEVKGARNLAFGDLDGEGTPDVVLVDNNGQLFIYRNQRSGYFVLVPTIPNTNNLHDIQIFDAKNDGVMDIVGVKQDGTVVRIFTEDNGTSWKIDELVKSSITDARLFVGDLDNNGAIDMIVAGKDNSDLLLGNADGNYVALKTPIPGRITGIGDLKEGGYLSLVGIDGDGKGLRFDAKPTKSYHSLTVRAFAEPGKKGDRRINPFGVGSELEMRAGLLWQKQIVTGPQTHFGLGTQSNANAVRAIWTNGSTNAIFDGSQGIKLTAQTNIDMPQPLTGSCPFLFAWDGTKFAFVTDCIWRSPLGLKINAQDTAGVAQTEDWLKIRGDQLKAKDGFYDLRITAELWETHFFDNVGLMAVDHPEGTDIFVDERFAIPGPQLKVHAVKTPQAILKATAETGEDVTQIVKERDLNHVDTFGRGQYQGVTRDHYLEIELPENAPKNAPLYVIANGWIHPTDTSINVAIGQRMDGLRPTGLSIETQDASGKWKVARPGLGFPEGKVKTILFRVDDLWKPGARRKLRLRTNLEIYWDQVRWAEGLPDRTYKSTPLALSNASLKYRGFSQMQPFKTNVPELPVCYSPVATTVGQWRDLEGNYTRFGDVKPLLTGIDDRYVIMNAGDEMHIRFPEAAPPSAGMVRDYVFIGDGWVKDGNYNTTFSHTVMPLPTHKDTSYKTPPGRLEDDPAYKLHPSDWEQYHTRYVSPSGFAQALKP